MAESDIVQLMIVAGKATAMQERETEREHKMNEEESEHVSMSNGAISISYELMQKYSFVVGSVEASVTESSSGGKDKG